MIENEIGEIPIDDTLLMMDKLALAEKVVGMENGCLCCTIRSDLVDGLKGLMDEMKQGLEIDQIMIETTGLADPVPITKTFMSNDYLLSKMRLDGVITVADAKHIIARLDDKVEEKEDVAYQQVAFCDRILLNKLDLVSPEQAVAVKERLRDINKFTRIIPSVMCRVKISELTNLRAHDMTNFAEIDLEEEGGEAELHGHESHENHDEHHGTREQEDHGGHEDGRGHNEDNDHGEHVAGHSNSHGNGHGTAHGDGHATGYSTENGEPASKKPRHDGKVNSFCVVKEGEISPKKLSKWMKSLAQLPPAHGTIFRIKAIMAIKDHPYKHVFHAVMDIGDEDDAGEWAPGEKRISKIVFIGKSLDQTFLRAGFEGLFV